jgi:pimeloyl-ACP methyl ester carboxylesterase
MLADGIPGARLTVLEDGGHFGHIEQPAEFVTVYFTNPHTLGSKPVTDVLL